MTEQQPPEDELDTGAIEEIEDATAERDEEVDAELGDEEEGFTD